MNNSKRHTYFAIQHNLIFYLKNPYNNVHKFYKRLSENKNVIHQNFTKILNQVMFVNFKGFIYYINLKFQYCYRHISTFIKKKNLLENSEIFCSKKLC